jgi:hypothetical protein
MSPIDWPTRGVIGGAIYYYIYYLVANNQVVNVVKQKIFVFRRAPHN